VLFTVQQDIVKGRELICGHEQSVTKFRPIRRRDTGHARACSDRWPATLEEAQNQMFTVSPDGTGDWREIPIADPGRF